MPIWAIRYHGVFLWNEVKVYFLSVGTLFGTFSALGARMGVHGWAVHMQDMVSKTIIDRIWEQHIEMLVLYGENVLRYPWGILFCGRQWWSVWARSCPVVGHFQWYANGLIVIWRHAFFPVSKGSQLGWDWKRFKNVAISKGNFMARREIVRVVWENKDLFVGGCHLQYEGCI